MSLPAITIARSIASQFYLANMYAAMDGQLALGTNLWGNLDAEALRNVANKGKLYNYIIENAELRNKIAMQMQETKKAMNDRYAKSFDTFS